MVALCLLVAGGLATSLTFENPADVNSLGIVGTGQSYTHPGNGENSYVWTSGTFNVNGYMIGGTQTDYAAATLLSQTAASGVLDLYDSSKVSLWSFRVSGVGRWEMKMIGGEAHLYKNGILATNSTPIINPTYVVWGSGIGTTGSNAWDDFVFGTTENKYILNMPFSDYVLVKDMMNPASSRFGYTANSTVISSTNMTTTWAKGNITYTGNETVVFQNVDTGTIYETKYTGLVAYGSVPWVLQDNIFNSGAPYGRYYVTIPSSGAYSDEIWYIGSGATVAFDKDTYSQGTLATMTYSISGAYWDTSTYAYSLDLISGTSGATVHTQSLSASSGTDTYTFTSTDPQGVYYAVVKATPNAGGDPIWMNYDYATLNAYVTISGYVNGAETNAVLSGANVSMVQSSIVSNSITIADGNYTATGFYTGSQIVITVNASGYYQYSAQFTPMKNSIALNFTLNSTTPTYTGLGIGGVDRDGVLSGTTITKGYGRPIGGATDHAKNTTFGDYCTNVSNMAGWYKFDESNGCVLTSGRLYDVWSEKIGYSNSGNYTVVAA